MLLQQRLHHHSLLVCSSIAIRAGLARFCFWGACFNRLLFYFICCHKRKSRGNCLLTLVLELSSSSSSSSSLLFCSVAIGAIVVVFSFSVDFYHLLPQEKRERGIVSSSVEASSSSSRFCAFVVLQLEQASQLLFFLFSRLLSFSATREKERGIGVFELRKR